jgi:Nitrile hydratase, alpha chain
MSEVEYREKNRQWARIFAKAWKDPDFKNRLLADPATVLHEEGMTVPPGTQIKAVENTDKVFYVNVPLKPTVKRPLRFEEGENYSKARPQLLHDVPAVAHAIAETQVPWAGSNWCLFTHKVWCDSALRQRFLADPVRVMAEYDLPLPPDVEIRVVENTAGVRYLVLPAQPAEPSGGELEHQAADAIPQCQCPSSRDLNRGRVGVLGKNGELFAFHEDINLEIGPDSPFLNGKPSRTRWEANSPEG